MWATATVRTAALRTALVGLLVGLSACGGDGRDAGEPTSAEREAPSATASAAPLPDHRVEVSLDGIQGAEGSRVAGVLFRGTSPAEIRHRNAVGGFGVVVDDDPFSLVAAIYDGSPIGRIPFLEGSLAEVSPGGYTLLMWRGPSLGPYSEWFPAGEPGITGCPVRFEVGDDEVTKVTVTGFPKQASPPALESLRPCLQ